MAGTRQSNPWGLDRTARMHALFRGLQRSSQSLGPELQQLVRGSASQAGSVTAAAAATSAKPVLEKEFLIYRWNPDSSEPPKYDSFKVDINS